jgi:hypothetical protein
MPSFSLSCFIGADSLVPAGPVNVKRLTSEPTKETRVDLNASLPTLADQLARAQGAATNNKPIFRQSIDMTKMLNYQTPLLPLVG